MKTLSRGARAWQPAQVMSPTESAFGRRVASAPTREYQYQVAAPGAGRDLDPDGEAVGPVVGPEEHLLDRGRPHRVACRRPCWPAERRSSRCGGGRARR